MALKDILHPALGAVLASLFLMSIGGWIATWKIASEANHNVLDLESEIEKTNRDQDNIREKVLAESQLAEQMRDYRDVQKRLIDRVTTLERRTDFISARIISAHARDSPSTNNQHGMFGVSAPAPAPGMPIMNQGLMQ